jgi:hypothetical protein
VVFSDSGKILKDLMTTATVDRLVHHSIVIELNLPSYHMQATQKSRMYAVSLPIFVLAIVVYAFARRARTRDHLLTKDRAMLFR